MAHPLLLSTTSRIVQLLVNNAHISAMHAGPLTILSNISRDYFIPGVKRLLRKISQTCVVCQKTYARSAKQYMGNLPTTRTNPARPFDISGLDFAGPFLVKEGNLRKPFKTKVYVCVYVCFITKAVFLDPVADLTTDCFMASLRRFVALYGSPSSIYSDNGSNFLGEPTLSTETSSFTSELH